jgi:hypothetical protein
MKHVGVLAAFVCVAARSPESHAGKSTVVLQKSVVPAGDGWYCWSAHQTYNHDDSTSGCARTQEACEEELNGFRDSSDGLNEFGECFPQKKAAVFTYRDVMREVYAPVIFGSMSECKSARRLWTKKRDDYESVSACTLVGRLEPPKLNRKLLPSGKGWNCAGARSGDDFGLGRCYRTTDECQLAIVDKVVTMESTGEDVPMECFEWADGWAFSASEDLYVYASKGHCESVRGARASRCEAVK